MREGGVDEAAIRDLVHAFYGRVRDDDLLGPVFAPRVGDAWPAHLARMVAFWSAVLLGRPGFRGDPVGKHRAIPELAPEHFDRWMALWGQVLSERFPAPVAADIHARAGRMRVVLEAGGAPGAGASGPAPTRARRAAGTGSAGTRPTWRRSSGDAGS